MHLYCDQWQKHSVPLNILSSVYQPFDSGGFPLHIDTTCIGLSSVCFKGSHVDIFLNHNVSLSPNVVLILANIADHGEMQHYAAFHLGLHCLPPKYSQN